MNRLKCFLRDSRGGRGSGWPDSEVLNQHFQIPIRPGNSGVKSHSMDSNEISIYYLCNFYYNIVMQKDGFRCLLLP